MDKNLWQHPVERQVKSLEEENKALKQQLLEENNAFTNLRNQYFQDTGALEEQVENLEKQIEDLKEEYTAQYGHLERVQDERDHWKIIAQEKPQQLDTCSELLENYALKNKNKNQENTIWFLKQELKEKQQYILRLEKAQGEIDRWVKECFNLAYALDSAYDEYLFLEEQYDKLL